MEMCGTATQQDAEHCGDASYLMKFYDLIWYTSETRVIVSVVPLAEPDGHDHLVFMGSFN
jgi:hypothetical protein